MAQHKTLAALAELTGGELRGDGNVEIQDVAAAEKAGPGNITFAVSPRYLAKVRQLRPAAVIVDAAVEDLDIPQIVHPLPQLAFIQIATEFHYREPLHGGISDQAQIHDTASVDPDCTVYPLVFIGARSRIAAGCRLHPGVVIGEDCVVGEASELRPNVTLGDGCEIGRRCLLHAGTVIGADGFGFLQVGGTHVKVPHYGTVRIEDDVEMGANCTVDRAVLGFTRIGEGSKFDNMVHVGHNCDVGRNVLLVAYVALAGSTVIGDGAILGPRSGTGDHVRIGAGAIVAGMSGVHKDVPDGAMVAGMPAFDAHLWRRFAVSQKRLPELISRVRELERRLALIEKE
ncbi:MAG: UDP-3-O-(3-hydroxymyristoyl)glucosamine N-acyltransferase [Candidatus Alcyoniella australis]|nr:UDP-3-O-(3-hydroxymyristoyl)glucosamine N-acyltransferase [Candidatus Alcyoniella australis]